MKKVAVAIIPFVLFSLVVSGCGGGASEDKPISEIRTEVRSMTAEDLQVMVNKYQKAIEGKKGEVSKLRTKVNNIPVKELMGKEAKSLKEEISKLSSTVRALMQRMSIYAQELRRKK